MRRVLDAPVEVRENSRAKRMSKRETIVTEFVNRAGSQDVHAMELLLRIPALQRELAELQRDRRLFTLETLERVNEMVLG
jgi:hypothetical protein